jgi:hypothetical protein
VNSNWFAKIRGDVRLIGERQEAHGAQYVLLIAEK